MPASCVGSATSPKRIRRAGPRLCWGLGILALASLGLAATPSPQPQTLSGLEILSKALDLRKGIEDFSARFAVHLDVEGLDMPDSSGTVYFKRPDKLRVVAERGVVILPKDAVMPTRISKAIAEGADVSLMGQQQTPEGVVYGLKIVPKGDEDVRFVAWVHGKNWTMQKMEVWQRSRRVMALAWEHTLVQKRFWLPRSVTCTLAQRPQRGNRRMRGTAAITFSQYQVNTGLADSLFAGPDESK